MEKRLTYLEIPATDAQRAAAFYQAVLGWSIDPRAGGAPHFQDERAHLIGRFVSDRASAGEPGVLPYFHVEEISVAVATAASHGGETVVAPYPEGDVWVARLRDPSGNLIGVWQFVQPG